MPADIPVICSTGSFWMWELERTFGHIAKAGFDAVELMVTRDPRSQSPEVVKRLAEKEGLRIKAVHAPMLVLTRMVWGPNFQRIITRSVDMAKSIGSEVVIIHPPYVWEMRYQTWLMRELDRFTAEHGVSVAVENMFRLWVGNSPVRGHRWVSPADMRRFHQVTLDTSHCGVDDFDILEALDLLEGRMAHIHLSDSRGDHRDSHALPGHGKLPLKEFLDRLPSSGFQGSVSLELDMREVVGSADKTIDTLQRAREFCLERIS